MGATISQRRTSDDSEEDDNDDECDSSDMNPEFSESSSEEDVLRRSPFGSLGNLSVYDLNATDAAANIATQPIELSLSDVQYIENNLDVYEKISLIYLLYDNPGEALENCVSLSKKEPRKALFNWASDQESFNNSWKFKLIEALCIVQNYSILKQFGGDKVDLQERFQPHYSFTSVTVNQSRKLLYHICDNLTQNETLDLLDCITRDFLNKQMEYKNYNPMYLEMYFLHWESIGYISQKDVQNLYKTFKQLDKLDICDQLKPLVPEIKDNSKLKILRHRRISNNKTVDFVNEDENNYSYSNQSNLSSMESRVGADSNTDNFYKIDENNPGLCYIINQEYFYREIDPQYQYLLPNTRNAFEKREGTEKDKNDLIETYESFGYKVVCSENLTHLQIIEQLNNVLKTITNESSLVVCIMSHGDQGVVYGVNSCEVKVSDIRNIICNTKALIGKPKVLILQSCQGTRCQKVISEEDEDELAMDGPTENHQARLRTKDMLTFWATVPGFSAVRHKKNGSWFIQALCAKMKEYENRCHFEDICTRIIHDVSNTIWDRNRSGSEVVSMVPIKESTFTKFFYLPKKL